ncbi:MAG: hypothetical protein JJU11_02085 [Candidatus Sumerlaeia bacterium]|nr:hypothetical protein [Candidatus Sumerlaeia bacterium]
MTPPPLRTGWRESQYRAHFAAVYCTGPIVTHDGIMVTFRMKDFDHCMYESDRKTRVKLTTISKERSERIDWIKATLTDPSAELYEGWDKKKKKYDKSRRVAFVYEDYVVVISIQKPTHEGVMRAKFITAYCADNSLAKIRSSPRWSPNK